MLVPSAGVVLGGEGGYGFDTWFGVSGEGARVLVSAFGLEEYGGDSFLRLPREGLIRSPAGCVHGVGGPLRVPSMCHSIIRPPPVTAGLTQDKFPFRAPPAGFGPRQAVGR